MRGITEHIRPTGHERTFAQDELIVSKTDPKGIITYVNHVFQDVSGYRAAEVVGRPHNVIRHPDMPAGLFHLLWETISSGREIFAYLNNLAADGANYWVLAHVTPSHHSSGRLLGYHSNRRFPERAPIEAVRPLYRAMLDVERGHNRRVDAARASALFLQDELASRGTTYDEFIWSLISGDTA